MNWAKTTTMENLWSSGCAEQGAVLKYGDKVLVTWLTWKWFEAAVYEFIEDEEETGLSYIECRLNLRTANPRHFNDGGDAMKWCFENLNN